jgi:hypothetical protein
MSQPLVSPGINNTEINSTEYNVTVDKVPLKGLLGLLDKDGSLGLSIKNDATSQFTQKYNSTKTYLSTTLGLEDRGSEVVNSLDQTNLDDPINTDLITQYPQFTQGPFGGASTPFSQQWAEENGYASNSNSDGQIDSLSLSGLDIENPSSAETTDNPLINTDYPELSTGEYNGASTQFTQKYTPSKTYLSDINSLKSVTTNPQTNTLDETGLDNTNPLFAPTTIVPNAISYPTEYPYISPQVSLGEFYGAPSQYIQSFTPTKTYLDNYNSIKNDTTNSQINSLEDTALDIENIDALPSALLFAPTNPDTVTVYPGRNVTGVTGSAPQSFNQVWKPTNEYYSYMKENYRAR